MDELRLHRALIDQLKKERAIRSAEVEAAFRSVPRHLFLPSTPLEQVYADAVVPTKFEQQQAISSSSQPSMMAIMLEQCALKPGMHVLEIGAGTGYNAALIASIVGDRGRVTTLDIDDDLIAAARDHLAAAGFAHRVMAVRADGWAGYPANAPYDRILLSVQARDLSPAWIDSLKIGGRMVLPLDVWAGAQLSVAFVKKSDMLTSVSAVPCAFMPLRGKSAAEPGELEWIGDHDRAIGQLMQMHTLEQWDHLIRMSYADQPTGIECSVYALPFSGFWLWLSSRVPGAVSVRTRGAENAFMPPLLGGEDDRHTFGIASATGLALLMRDPAADEHTTRFSVFVRWWGDDAPLKQLITLLRAWTKAGQPDARKVRIAAAPVSVPPRSAREVVMVTKRHYRYYLKW